MAEPTITNEDQEAKAHFDILDNTGFTYEEKDVLVGDPSQSLVDTVKGYVAGDVNWLASYYLREVGFAKDFVYLLMRRTGTFNGLVNLYVADVDDSPLDRAGEPQQNNLVGGGALPYQVQITAAAGEWQIIPFDVKIYLEQAAVLFGKAGAGEDLDIRDPSRPGVYIVVEKAGTVGNTWEIALVDNPTYEGKVGLTGEELFSGIQHWCVSPDATATSWIFNNLPALQGGTYAPVKYTPYISFKQSDDYGIQLRGRYEEVGQFNAFGVNDVENVLSTAYGVAQSFTPTVDTVIDVIQFKGKVGVSPTEAGVSSGSFVVSVYQDGGGDPDGGTLVGSARFRNNTEDIIRESAWKMPMSFVFLTPITLTTGIKYWFVIPQLIAGNGTLTYARLEATPTSEYDYTSELYDSSTKDGANPWVLNTTQPFLFSLYRFKETGSEVTIQFPDVRPEKVHSWNRIKIYQTNSPTLYVQHSNDGGLGFGVSGPDFNDGMWGEYSVELLKTLECMQNGNDILRLKVVLSSPQQLVTMLSLFFYVQSPEPSVAFAPRYTTKEFTASLHRSLDVSTILNGDIEAGEGWVTGALKEANWGSGRTFSYEDFMAVADNDDVVEFQRRLRMAASYATIAYIQGQGRASTTIGPMLSVSADGMSKSTGYFNSGSANYTKGDGIAITFEEKAAREIKGIVKFWFAAGYGNNEPLLSRRNEFLEPDYDSSGIDVRRKDKNPNDSGDIYGSNRFW